MSTRNSSKSSLFLIELIIAILFFSIGSAVCVRAFMKAHSLSTEAKDLSFASAQVSSMASVLKYTDRSYASIREHFLTQQKAAMISLSSTMKREFPVRRRMRSLRCMQKRPKNLA